MKNKYLVIFFLCLYLPVKILSQNCPPLYEKGSVLYLAQGDSGYFCFKRDPIPLIDSIPNVYQTKYTIAFDKGRETYTIHFYFYKVLDSISIVYMNTVIGKTVPEKITFMKHSSIRMFKNYKANDTTISENDRYCTLFTVLNTQQPYVTLNFFQLPDNKNTYLTFTPVNTEKLFLHREEASAFFNWKDSMDLAAKKERERIEKHKNTVDSILKDMNDYKVKVIQKIKDDDNQFKLNGPTLEASKIYSEEFKNKLDPLFIDYLKKICPFENFDSEIKFTFTCNGDGQMDSTRTTIDSVNSPRIKWLEDSFKANIQPPIVASAYRVMNTTTSNPNLIADFENKYRDAINYFLSDNTDNNEYKEFAKVKKQIYNEFDDYIRPRTISNPTKYSYSIKYKSTVTPADWVYEIDNGVEKIGPKKSNEIIPETIKNIFKIKIAKPKVGKYKIKICNVSFNNESIEQDIISN